MISLGFNSLLNLSKRILSSSEVNDPIVSRTETEILVRLFNLMQM